MLIKLGKENLHSEFVELIERISGEELANCYQCGNCTGGCPVSYAMDFGPREIIRLLQLGQEDTIKSANSPWLCVGCLQCYCRCPKGVSAAKILEALRQLSLRKGESHEEIKEIPFPFLKNAPQQAIVCGFRKFVS
ncbi:MAG: 4Fe-4S dicluster domain-containing protein [Deltaproteobacteria bacterium]|nr:4Fe-4S dicluster domain-containing protein [Deltaproteobacteria bacterium]